MTIFLTILGVLLLLILLITMLRVHLIIEADTSARVYIKLLFIKIRLYPKEKKELNLKDYSPKRIAKRARKMKKKAEVKLKKEAKKSKRNKKKQEQGNTSEKSSKRQKLSLAETTEIVALVLELTKTFFRKFGQRLRLDLTKIHINVGSEDAAKTALTYGAICSGVSCLCEFLDSMFTVRSHCERDIIVNADFLSEATNLDITINVSLRVWEAIDIALAVAINFVKQKILNK